MTDPSAHMAHALALGRRGLGRTWPNPAVGCVLVRDGRIVGRGWTQPGGRPHAEVMALRQAGQAARGATAFVTLEPCAHHGETGPCADALIAAGVTRVVAAIEDPDPRVSGKGLAMLRAAGVQVETGLGADQARRDLRGFLLNRTEGRPDVTLKLAMTLDGRIATASGESQWITGAEARRAVHAMRASHDAVMVGAGTARADDPSLNVRGIGVTHQPVRVVVSRKLDLPLTGKLALSAGEIPLWLIHGPDVPPALASAWDGLGARRFAVPLSGRQIDLRAAMAALGQAGLTRVFCEGGGQLAASLLAAGLTERLALFSAGCVIGAEGQPGIGALGIGRLAEAPRLHLREIRPLGPDMLSLWECGPAP